MMTDDELMAAFAPIARGIKAGELPAMPFQQGPGRSARNLCPCGSGHLGYNLHDHTGQLLMYCCFTCEKPRRAARKDDGETLTD
jgi:hypothetical protein